MSTTFVIDSLLEYDNPSYLLELLLSFDEEAKIMTLCYRPENFYGRFKKHQIVASGLNRWVKKKEDLRKHKLLTKAFSRSFSFSAEDEIVVISSGLAHSYIPKKLQAKAHLYLVDVNQGQLNLNSLKNFSKIAIAHKKFHEILPGSVFLGQTFQTAEFFIDPNSTVSEIHLVHKDGLSLNEEKFFKSHSSIQFFENQCDGTLQSMQINSKVVWDLSGDLFPAKALKAQLAGKLVVVREGVDTTYLNSEGFLTLPRNCNEEQIKVLLEKANQLAFNVDPTQLRRSSLKWNERFFKTQFQYFLRGELE